MPGHEHDPIDSPYGRALEELTEAADAWGRTGATMKQAAAALARLKRAAHAFVIADNAEGAPEPPKTQP